MLSIMRISTLDLRLLRYQLIGACGIIVALTLLTSCTIVSGINGPSLVQSGQANNSGYVYPSFSECETELFCGFANYDEFLMASGVKWQEWQYPNEPPYYLLVQDGWWGIMPGEPGGPSFPDYDGIRISYVYSTHYDSTTYISEPVPGKGLNCYGFVEEAMPVWKPCEASFSNYTGHEYHDTFDIAYEWVNSSNGSIPLNNGGEVNVLTGNP